MVYIVLSAMSVLVMVSSRTNIFSKSIFMLSAVSSAVYYIALLKNGNLLGVGRLGDYIALGESIYTAQFSHAILLFALAFYARSPFPERVNRSVLDAYINKFRVKPYISLIIIIVTYIVLVINILSIGFDTLFSYRGYGSIKDINEIYGSGVTRSIVSNLRVLIIALIPITIVNFYSRKRILFWLAIPAIILAFLIVISSASRLISLYFAVAALAFYLMGRRKNALFYGVLAIFGIGYSLEARNHDYLGLNYVFEYISGSIFTANFFERIITNVGAGLLVTSASVKISNPEYYDYMYKILSFSPSLGFMDGFQAVREVNEQRIMSYIPVNAFGEAWAFGWIYYIFLWGVIFISARCVNSSARYGRVVFALMIGFFMIAMVFASQYPVRNAIRYFYGLIALRIVMGFVMPRLKIAVASRATMAGGV